MKNVITGYFDNGQPFVIIGNGADILVCIEPLSFEHKPPRGFMLNQVVKAAGPFLDKYTVYRIGRKPDMPDEYLSRDMVDDYATLIRKIFEKPVDVIGESTGGQLALCLAADHPDTVRKLVILSAAFRISERGAEIERRSAAYFARKKYGKAMAVLMELIFPGGLKSTILRIPAFIIGALMLRNLRFPRDFLIEVKVDRQMNCKEKLSEIEAPTFVLHGVDDICYTAEDAHATASLIPKGTIIRYKGFGHNLSMANHNQVMKDIRGFLNGQDR